MKRFKLSSDAAQDIEEIWEHIARDDIEAADRVAESILDAARRLGANPRIGHKREDLAEDRPLLFWPVGITSSFTARSGPRLKLWP